MRSPLRALAFVVTAAVALVSVGGCESIYGISDLPTATAPAACPAPAGACSTVSSSGFPSSGGPACTATGPCSPADETTFSPAWVPSPTRIGQCTTDQIASYYVACLDGTTATQSDCDTWTSSASNSTCFGCLESPPSATSLGALIHYAGVYVVNIAGCIAAAEPCNMSCAEAVLAQLECQNAACDSSASGSCPVTDMTSLTNYRTCIGDATTSNPASCSCSDYAAAASCIGSITGTDHFAETACGLSATTFQDKFTAVAVFMCGHC